MATKDPADMREDYRERTLSESEAGDDPMTLFASWFSEAVESGTPEPNAMSLATCDLRGRPSVRVVLMKGHDARGIVFYTNHESRKGRELEVNPVASVVFWWPLLERQVRMSGAVERVDLVEADRYFGSRPRASRIGAWASRQSTAVASREALESRFVELDARFGEVIEKPPFWGGYRVLPDEVEFWQGRTGRLHDRLHYRRSGGTWLRERLSP